jgi:hypothetical protein
LITGSSDLGFTVDETPYGSSLSAGHLFLGDKIIVKENVNGTESIAQGTVNTVNQSTGAVTVSAWDTGSTFPTGGFTVNATVFKWQREYFDITKSLSTQRDSLTQLTFRITDGSLGANIWLDDIRSSTGYLNDPFGSTITSSLANRYFQYRAILTQNDLSATSSALTTLSLDYVQNTPPNIPSLDLPTDTATHQVLSTVLKTTTTDPNGESIKYKFNLCTDVAMTLNCQIFDQTSSATGWSAASYASGVQGVYTLQTALNPATTYYWTAQAIDQGGSNTWSAAQAAPFSFTTDSKPGVATLDLPANSATDVTRVTVFKATSTDVDGNVLKYKVLLCTNNALTTGCQTFDQTVSATGWSAASYASGVQAVYTVQAALTSGATYYWKAYAIDQTGSNAWSDGQTTADSFTVKGSSASPAPCTITKAPDNSSITVNWTDTANEENFQVWRVVDGGVSTQFGSNLAPNTIQVVDSTVSLNHSYGYLIRGLRYDGATTLYSGWCATTTTSVNTGSFFMEGINLN